MPIAVKILLAVEVMLFVVVKLPIVLLLIVIPAILVPVKFIALKTGTVIPEPANMIPPIVLFEKLEAPHVLLLHPLIPEKMLLLPVKLIIIEFVKDCEPIVFPVVVPILNAPFTILIIECAVDAEDDV